MQFVLIDLCYFITFWGILIDFTYLVVIWSA